MANQPNSYNASFVDDNTLFYPKEWVIPITITYGIIFITGVVGNVSTCIVIKKNKSLQTVTNYYLFSIAVSDLLLLISGLPQEMYNIWAPETYVFGETVCVLQGFASETSVNATVLTITAFTIERYLAICHPFLSHTMSNLSRAVKLIFVIWITAFCLAAPQALQFGIQTEIKNGIEHSRCSIKSIDLFEHAFEISTFVIFVGPMTLITVLYILIALKLRKSSVLSRDQRASVGGYSNCEGLARIPRNTAAQKRVIKMLVAVVAAFFICWAPFHAQRLLAVYLVNASKEAQAMCMSIYIVLMYISGVLYFFSTTVNPVLYLYMSHKFREAFRRTFYEVCLRRSRKDKAVRLYSVLSRCPTSTRKYQASGGNRNFGQPPACRQSENLSEAKDVTECLLQPYEQTTPARRATSNNQRNRNISQSSQITTLTTVNNEKDHLDSGAATRAEPEFSDPAVACNQHRKHLVGIRKIFCLLSPKETTFSNSSPRQSLGGSTNTISNSSLKGVEDIELSSSELMRYMEEVNEELS